MSTSPARGTPSCAPKPELGRAPARPRSYFEADSCTYAATSAICCALSWSPKGGIAPIPFVTRSITSASAASPRRATGRRCRSTRRPRARGSRRSRRSRRRPRRPPGRRRRRRSLVLVTGGRRRAAALRRARARRGSRRRRRCKASSQRDAARAPPRRRAPTSPSSTWRERDPALVERGDARLAAQRLEHVPEEEPLRGCEQEHERQRDPGERVVVRRQHGPATRRAIQALDEPDPEHGHPATKVVQTWIQASFSL